MSVPPEIRYSFDKVKMLYDSVKRKPSRDRIDLDQRADRVRDFLAKALEEGRVAITHYRDENIVAWRDKVPSTPLRSRLSRFPDVLYAYGSRRVSRKDLPGTPDMYDIVDLNDARLALGFHEKEWAEWGEGAYKKSREFGSSDLGVSGIYGEMKRALGWGCVPSVFYYLLTRKTQWWIECRARVPMPDGDVIDIGVNRGDAQWKTWPEYRQLVIEQVEDFKSISEECPEISLTLTKQEVRFMFQHNEAADALIAMAHIPELPHVVYDELVPFNEEDLHAITQATGQNAPIVTVSTEISPRNGLPEPLTPEEDDSEPVLTGECRARADLLDAWAQRRVDITREVLQCAETYWYLTGDPLGALEILNDVPCFREDHTARTARYMTIAQTVVDEMERECLWDRVYPPEFPIGARWKNRHAHPGLSCGRDVWPALLVDRDDNRVMFRIGEWRDGPPTSREIIVSSSLISDDLNPGDYVQASCIRDSGELIGVERQITPPTANLTDTRSAVRRLWGTLLSQRK